MGDLNQVLFKKLIWIILLITAAACVGEQKPTTKADCPDGFAFDQVSRSCLAAGQSPVATLSSVTVDENSGSNTVNLEYSDGNSDRASSCLVNNDDPAKIELSSPRQFHLSDESLSLLARVNQVYNIITPAATLERDTAVNAVHNIRKATSLSSSLSNRDIFIQAARSVAQAAVNSGGAMAITTGQTLMSEAQDYESYFAELSDRCHCTSGVCETVLVPLQDQVGNSGFSYQVLDPNDGLSATRSVAVNIQAEAKKPLAVHHDVSINESDTHTPLLQTFPTLNALINSPATYSLVSTTTKGTLNNCFAPFNSPATCVYTPFDGDMSDEHIGANDPRVSLEAGEFATLNLQGLDYTAVFKGEAGNDVRVRYSEYQGLGHPPELSVRVFSDANGPIIDVVVVSNLTLASDILNAINNASNSSSSFVNASLPGGDTTVTAVVSTSLSGGENAQDTFTYRVCEGMVCSDYDGVYTIRIQEQNDAPVVNTNASSTLPDPPLEDGVFTLTLDYSDSDSALLATSCTVDPDATELSVVNACSCDALGVCTADLQGRPDFFGTTTVEVDVTNDGKTSLKKDISLSLKAVNDRPALLENITGTPEHVFADDSALENDGVNIGAAEIYESIELLVDRGDLRTLDLEKNQDVQMEIEILYTDDTFQDVIPQTSEFVEIEYKGSDITDSDNDETSPVTASIPDSMGALKFRLTPDKFKDTSITNDLKVLVRLQDNGGSDDGGIDKVEYEFELAIVDVDFPPSITQKNSGQVKNVETNEGGHVYSYPFIVTEGGESIEPGQQMQVRVTSDNSTLLPEANIEVFYDENDNGLPDAGAPETRGNAGAGFVNLEATAADPSGEHSLILRLKPVGGQDGTSNVTITVDDGNSQDSVTFALVVHPVSAIHGGWEQMKAISHKVFERGQLDPNRLCLASSDKCNGGGDCQGSVAPNSTVVADEVNAIYYDQGNDRCYHATSSGTTGWQKLNTFCPVTKTDENANCNGASCLDADTPMNLSIAPTELDQYFFDYSSQTCFRSTATSGPGSWEEYFPAEVTLGWNDFVLAGSGADSDAAISGWNIYRRQHGAPFDFTRPINESPLAPSAREYVDDSANFETIYYYIVRPIDSKRSLATATDDVYSEVRIPTPPKSMGLVHRWMANLEVCEMMGKTLSGLEVDPNHNFRCEYNGPGAVDEGGDKYYDIQRDLFVDRVEVGCPFSRGTQAVATCGSNGCIGLGPPSFPVSTDGLVYYDRSSAVCYVSHGANTWEEVQSTGLALNGSDLIEKGPSSLLPPLSNIKQERAQELCQARGAVSTIDGLSSPVGFELPSRKEQMAYSAAPLGIPDNSFAEVERGLSLNSSSKCNSSRASGLESGYTNSAMPSTSFYYSLPGSASSGIRSMTTGSVPVGPSLSSESCVSRYGLQDVYGNVSEWVIERMVCSGNVCTSALAIDPSPVSDLIDPSYTDNMSVDSPNYPSPSYDLNGKLGPCRDIDANGVCDAPMNQWPIQDKNHGASFLSFPLGLPIHNSFVFDFPNDLISSSALEIGPTSGITNGQLKNDAFILNTAAIEQSSNFIGGMATGGGYQSEKASGRYTFEMVPNEDISAVAATGGTLFSDDSQTTLSFSAQNAGSDGNAISVGLISSSTATATSGVDALTVSVSGSSIVVEVETGGASEAQDIRDSINNHPQASNLVSVSLGGDGDLSNTFSAQTGEYLTGGLDAVLSRRNDIGFRCMVPLTPSSYSSDAEHTYSY